MFLAPFLWVVAAVVLYFFTARTWFPPAIDAHARTYDAHFALTAALLAAVFVAAQALLGFVVWRYRDRGRPARYLPGSTRLELLWTAVAASLFLGLGLTGMRIFAAVQLARPEPGALVVEVTAKQFAWNFRYPGPDGTFGRTDIKLVNDAAGNPLGLDPKDPAGSDDIVAASLRIPAGRPIRLLLHSRDVVHSFFVRELRLKQDLVPGMEIPLEFRASRPGVYEIPCAELCGLGHQQMRSTLHVMTVAEFEQWKQRPTRK